MKEIRQLCDTIETMMGRKMTHPSDFDFLCKQVEGYTGERISVSTLKRLWNYVPHASNPSHYTLELLSRMIGYEGWDDFSKSDTDEAESSHRIVVRKLYTSALTPGTYVQILWKPERRVLVRFEGDDLFFILESENSKLQVGDTFHCAQFVERQPLFLSGLYRPGMVPCGYICGKQGGVVWNLIEKS